MNKSMKKFNKTGYFENYYVDSYMKETIEKSPYFKEKEYIKRYISNDIYKDKYNIYKDKYKNINKNIYKTTRDDSQCAWCGKKASNGNILVGSMCNECAKAFVGESSNIPDLSEHIIVFILVDSED